MLNVLCLKFGTKYSSSYVNKLYNMVQRHLTVPHRFVCFTEDPIGLNSNIEVRSLPIDPGIKGWWWKTYLFKADHFTAGEPNLYLDLDIVIVNNIDKLVSEKPGNFMGFEDPSTVFSKQSKLNSSVMRWQSGHLSDIWDVYSTNRIRASGLQGDQDWIWRLHQDKIKFYPDPWIQSYKWQVRNHKELVRVGSVQAFNTVRNPTINPDTSILVFHGTPNPEHVQDPIVVDNWQ
jgi:hypothetical protein